MLNVDVIPCLNDNYSYIIYDDVSNLVGVVDPSEFDVIDIMVTKKYKKLDFILNTHHHFDHVGGNIELKKKYFSKIAGAEVDKHRIPGIDILLNEKNSFKFGNINFEIVFVPGHTSGHLAFYSESEKIIFTGDTLFSLGCGKIFEGSPKQMYASLAKIKRLPEDTKIYCGHEYTKANLEFCKKYDKDNKKLFQKEKWISSKLEAGNPTVPITIKEELETNIFLRCANQGIKKGLKMNESPEELIFKKLRNLKDDF